MVAHPGDAQVSDSWLLVSPWIWWLSWKFWFLVVPVVSVLASDSLQKLTLSSCRGFRNPLEGNAHPQGGVQGGSQVLTACVWDEAECGMSCARCCREEIPSLPCSFVLLLVPAGLCCLIYL